MCAGQPTISPLRNPQLLSVLANFEDEPDRRYPRRHRLTQEADDGAREPRRWLAQEPRHAASAPPE